MPVVTKHFALVSLCMDPYQCKPRLPGTEVFNARFDEGPSITSKSGILARRTLKIELVPNSQVKTQLS